jgi:hypothetical protein
MKPWHVISIVGLVIAVTTLLYYKQVSTQHTDIDALKQQASRIAPLIRNGNIIYGGDSNNVELLLKTRYAFAPIVLQHRPFSKADTVLEIRPLTDTNRIAATQVLYSAADSFYIYRLVIPM